MKVLHLINTLSAGGAELHLLTLSRRLKARGLDLVVACLREKVAGSRSLRGDFEAEGVKVVSFEGHGRIDRAFLARTYVTMREERPDILHTHLPRADFAGLVRRFVSPRAAWVSSVHNVYGRYWSGRWALPAVSLAWKSPDSVIAISRAVKDWLIAERGVPAEKVHLVYYGLDPEMPFGRGLPARTDGRRRRGADSDKLIGAIGRLEPRKGHQTLIEAMPLVLERVPDARLSIAGHDPWDYGKTLRSLIDRLGLDGKVELAGFQSDVGRFLDALDVFAFASVSEGFGQVLIEAMAASKPVVATDIPPINEIIKHEGSGLLAAPTKEAFADALTALLTQPDRAARMGGRGNGVLRERFSAERMAEETVAVYEQALTRAGVRSRVDIRS